MRGVGKEPSRRTGSIVGEGQGSRCQVMGVVWDACGRVELDSCQAGDQCLVVGELLLHESA